MIQLQHCLMLEQRLGVRDIEAHWLMCASALENLSYFKRKVWGYLIIHQGLVITSHD
jgi:hypothetical protein